MSAVSHELRTPLTSVLGSLNLFAEGVAGELSERGKALLGIAHANMERLVRLINDILGLDDIQTGKLELHQAPADLTSLLEQVIDDNRKRAAAVQVEIKLKNAAPDVQVYVDRDRLMYVINHLVLNGIKFSPDNDQVEITLSQRDDMVRVSVRDHGPGIPDAFRDKIFQAFTQVEMGNYRPQEGAGLGLTIAKAIVEKHGGRIGFETESVSGTCFYIDLPVWREEASTERTPNRKSANRDRKGVA